MKKSQIRFEFEIEVIGGEERQELRLQQAQAIRGAMPKLLPNRPELKSVRQRAQELPSSAMSDGLGHVAAALAIVPVDTMAPFWGAHIGGSGGGGDGCG